MHHVVHAVLGTPTQIEASASPGDSVSLVELAMLLSGWLVLGAALIVRKMRQPRRVSA